jgi:DNA-binding CsgD family transcriptional regulator
MGIRNGLSDRELEILRLVATGASNKEIAHQLQISMNTVKVHLRNIFEKTSVLSRTEATLYAIEHGLVSPPGQPAADIPPSPTFWGRHGAGIIRWGIVALVLITMTLVWNAYQARLRQPAAPMISLPVIVTATPAPIWQVHPDSPVALKGATAVAFETQIILLGGETVDGINPGVFLFQPQDESWSQGLDKPTPVYRVRATLLAERIYVPGGITRDGSVTNVMEVYDPRSNTWETAAPMPAGLADYGLATHEGKIYLFGGWDGEQVTDLVYEFNPSTDTWTEKSPLPLQLEGLAAVENRGRIFILGGKNTTGEASQAAFIYFPGRDRDGDQPWSPVDALPGQGDWIQAVSLVDGIFLTGIAPPSGSENGIYQYAAQDKVWAMLEAAPLRIGDEACLVGYGNSLFIIGGTRSENFVKTIQSIQVLFTLNIPAVTK